MTLHDEVAAWRQAREGLDDLNAALPIIDAADELAEVVGEFLNLPTRERIALVLVDENGLHPTEAALDVIMAVVDSINATDENYTGPGAPDARRYRIDAKEWLRTPIGAK